MERKEKIQIFLTPLGRLFLLSISDQQNKQAFYRIMQ